MVASLRLSRPLSLLSRTTRCNNITTSLPHFAALSLSTSHNKHSFPPARTTSYSTRTPNDHILTLSCPDRPGIVHAVTGLLAQHSLNILESQQFSDPSSSTFFMRVHFGQGLAGNLDTPTLSTAFNDLGASLQMDLALRPVAQKPKVLILVSKQLHCLADLLFRARSGQLGVDIPLIVSNHNDAAGLAQSYGISFHHLPVTASSKQAQEQKVLELAEAAGVDLVVLARYMQVLSPTLTEAMSGRIINIHHSFLPSFKGAKPYHQAYDRGVKLIGATAHFVTEGLDEGPIIEQRVVRVDHGMSPRELTQEGSNVEVQVLAAAIKLVAERRVLINQNKTVVFS